MKVALYGATGKSGSRILKELVSRGHQVTAIVRDPAKIPQPGPGVFVKRDDLSEPKKIAAAINGAEAVISAYAPPQDDPDAIVGVTQRLIDALGGGTSARLIVVGGAGGRLYPGVTLVDSGYVPEPYLPISRSHVKAFNVLRASTIEWTYLAPAASAAPRANAPANSAWVRTSSSLTLSRKAAFRWRTTPLHWWTSLRSRATGGSASPSGTNSELPTAKPPLYRSLQ